MGKTPFYGDGLTSKALQYQFYIFFKQLQPWVLSLALSNNPNP